MRSILCTLTVCLFAVSIGQTAETNAVKDLNTPRTFPMMDSKAQWQARAKEIREEVLVSCGLWPMPTKTPLRTQMFDRREREGYSVEKVFFQSYPGFYVGGNLYRPIGKGRGPFPGILNPHGHWENGRFADTKDGSIAARCISFARQGMIAFSYDMVGYNDTRFADPAPDAASQPLPSYKEHRAFGTNAVDQLWNISLMGLQTWNSIRALDFLESLPDVDKKRLACTGESGGGTQTFMLGAIDRRLAAQAPVVMVSHTMQGGCSCENAPGLRVDYSNMEIAAVPAPRPQILVAASGDWTKDTMTVEGPAIEKVYNLFDATDKFRYVRFDFNHNYNQTSREAVYEWFGRFLLHSPDRASLKEAPYTKEPDDDLRVFPRGKQPPDTVTAQALVTQVIAAARKNLADEKPTNKKTLADFKDEFAPAWRHTLKVTIPDTTPSAESAGDRNAGKISMARFTVAAPRGRTVPVTLLQVAATRQPRIAVLVDHRGKSAFLAENGEPKGLAAVLLQRDVSVLVFDAFLTGDLANQALSLQRKPFENFFTTYNRTDLQERVQDIVTACAFAKGKGSKVVLVGQGRGGLWALLAAPAADAVIADVDGHDTTSDEALLAQDLFAPGLRRIGDFAGAATLAAPHPLCVYNTAERFQTQWLRDVYQAVGAQQEIKVETAALDDQKVADWVGRVR